MPQSKVFRRSDASSEGNSSLPQVSRLLTFRVEISIISRERQTISSRRSLQCITGKVQDQKWSFEERQNFNLEFGNTSDATIRGNRQLICSLLRRPETVLEIREKRPHFSR